MNFNWHRSLQLNWRKLKRLLEWVIFGLFDNITLFRHNPQPNSSIVAIVQLKLLGDYVLWWPYALSLIKHEQAQGKHVVLVLNASVLPLAKRHFDDCTVLGIDRVCFLRNFSTRAVFLRQLRHIGANITYHDTYPRDGLMEDTVVWALGAPAWGFDATFADRFVFDQTLSRRLYAHLLPPLFDVHQSQRHCAFIRAVGAREIDFERRDFAKGLEAPIQNPYFIIAPGSSRSERRWPVCHFIEIAKRILTNHPTLRCVIVGTRDERALGETITQTLGNRASNLAGATSLLDLVCWIAHARLVVGNDSAACHIAAACGVASIAIVGGGHPGQFFPYDPEACVRRLPVTVREPMDCFGCNWICRYVVEKNQPYRCILAITPKRVWVEVEKLLPNQD